MLFNPDPKKPAYEEIFSRKKMKKPILVSFTTIFEVSQKILISQKYRFSKALGFSSQAGLDDKLTLLRIN